MTELIILTGYLGSGKTTTLRHVLEHLPQTVTTAVIINEYASTGIDGKIIDDTRYTVKELENGCICCTRGRDLKEQITYLTQQHNPDIILVETTGVAEPEPLLAIIQETNTPIKGVVTVLDAYQYQKTNTLGEVSKRQIKLSSLIVINKKDLVSETTINQLIDQVQALNPNAEVCTTQHGALATHTLLSAPRPQLAAHKRAKRVHRHDTTSLTLTTQRIIPLRALEEFLAKMPADVARAKGVVRTAKGYRLFQYAAGLYTIEPARKPSDSTGVFVFIGPLSISTRLGLVRNVHKLAHKKATRELLSHAAQLIKSLH